MWRSKAYRELECRHKKALCELSEARRLLSEAGRRAKLLDDDKLGLIKENNRLKDTVEFAGNWIDTLHEEWSNFKDKT
jgi:hypothetical protein